MNEVEKLFELVSQINSSWQLLGFVAILCFIFGCLWLLYKIIKSM